MRAFRIILKSCQKLSRRFLFELKTNAGVIGILRYRQFLRKLGLGVRRQSEINFTPRMRALGEIPVIIVNRDRLTYLKAQLDWIDHVGLKNVTILDNASSYLPLLEFYRESGRRIIYLKKNWGYLALWRLPLFRSISTDFYIYTDPDIVPIKECPSDFLDYFRSTLMRFPKIEKVGFGLRIDDLEPMYANRSEVLAMEGKYWKRPIADGLYDAPIDTTFALYRPGSFGGYWIKALRTGYPYLARHLPWYEESNRISEEIRHYVARVDSGTEWSKRSR
jgi:hypothetical protein